MSAPETPPEAPTPAEDLQTCAALINQPAPPVADLPFALTPPRSKARDACDRPLPF